jgi:hypothetical protein
MALPILAYARYCGGPEASVATTVRRVPKASA